MCGGMPIAAAASNALKLTGGKKKGKDSKVTTDLRKFFEKMLAIVHRKPNSVCP